MYNIFMKRIFLLITIALILANTQLVRAESIPTSISPEPNYGTVTGVNSGNIQSFEIKFDLSEIPKGSIITSAKLTYAQSAVSTGILRFIDKNSTEIIDSQNLITKGDHESNTWLNTVQKWFIIPNRNMGVLIQASLLGVDDKITIWGMNLELEYILPDNTAPAILDANVYETGTEYAKIKISSDETVSIKIDYGKTSLYGQSVISDNIEHQQEHDIQLDHLLSGVTYHYKITLSDAFDNKLVSEDMVFNTLTDFDINSTNSKIDINLASPKTIKTDIIYRDQSVTISISWDPSTESTIKGYYLYRATEIDNKYVEYKVLGPKENSYIDEDISLGQKYNYYVRAFSDNAISPKSNEKSVQIPINLPEGNTAAPTTIQNFLFVLAVASMILFVFYLIIKIRDKYEGSQKKHLRNVLKDPDYFMDKK
jgi:hypothetical protein